jgi:hypothetical protein
LTQRDLKIRNERCLLLKQAASVVARVSRALMLALGANRLME